jgi:D-3-phosphoglycerate dehydrogenase / 2-oxoglutarate reductase
MMTFKVLITDYAWPSLDIEQEVLSGVGAELVVAQTGDEAELVQLARDVDAIMTNWKPVTPRVLDMAQRCLIVSRYGIGLDNIAVAHATELGMLVTNVPHFCLDEVSDHVLALLLACARQLTIYAQATRSGIWKVGSITERPILRIRGQTLGLIGCGNIARALIPKALGLGLKIIAYTPHLRPDALAEFGPNCSTTNELDILLRTSDYISIHTPLTAETRGMIDTRALRLMKPTAYLLNTSRGAIINETALYEALTKGWLAGAGLDVLAPEPPSPTNPLLTLDNVIITPHVAFYSEDALADVQREAAEHVAQVLRKETPSNIVNPAVIQQRNYRLGDWKV